MDYAVEVKKFLLKNDRVVFEPVGIIKGKYDAEKEQFKDEFDFEYSIMNGTRLHDDRYFFSPTNITELKQAYGDLEEKELLNELLSSVMNFCFVGYFDMVKGKIELIHIDFEKLETEFLDSNQEDEKEQEETVEVVEFDPNANERFIFDRKGLMDICELGSIDEVRNHIQELVKAGDYIQEINQQKDKRIEPNEEIKEEKELNKLKLDKDKSKKFDFKKLNEFILSEVVAQDEAVRQITTRIGLNVTSSDYRHKSHLLLAGPTGVGKTRIIQLISEYLDIPFAKVDSTDYTQVGFVGRSVDEMILRLIREANNDIELAQRGILFVDEIDKKVPKDNSSKGDIATKAVLDGLLKITGRGIVQVDIMENNQKKTIDFDTSNLTVIFGGAFQELFNDIQSKKNEKKSSLGFIKQEEKKNVKEEIGPKDLIKYGMTAELIGRIKCFVQLKSLKASDYVQIMYKSKSSPLLIEKNYYEKDQKIKFIYTSNYVMEIAKQAEEFNAGVRGLESVLAKSLEHIASRVLNKEKIKQIKLTRQTAIDNTKYFVE